nr:methyltransferase domain-containing protein [Desulfobacula sp.]
MRNQKALLDRNWFYEFELPNGIKTKTDCSDGVRQLHLFRRTVLLDVIQAHFGDRACNLSALDIGSHEGYFTLELAKRFKSVQGIEKNAESFSASKKIFDAFGLDNIDLICNDLLSVEKSRLKMADLVLLYGVIYHLEDPISLLRKAASLASRVLLLETQILNFDMEAKIDWGNYESQKNVTGVFGVVSDEPEAREGGQTEIALVPSMNALYAVLNAMGFSTITKISDSSRMCEQFYRDRRVILLCIR